MRQPYLVVGALLVGMLQMGSAVFAQAPGQIPSSAVSAQGTLTERDQQLVNSAIDHWVKELQAGNAHRSAAARRKLVEPYTQGATETFVKFYDQSLAARIAAGMAATDVAGRLNTQLVARNVRSERVIDVIKQGLKDEASAVVLHAAAAAHGIAVNKDVATAVKFGLRVPVADAVKKESSPFVLSYLYLALIEIGEASHWDVVMTKFGERLAAHVASPNAGLDVEFDAVRALYNKIITARISDPGKVTDKVLTQFTLICARYLHVAANLPATDAERSRMIALFEQGGLAAIEQLNKGGAKIKVPGTLANKTANEEQLMLSDWRTMLMAEPFNFTEAQIVLPAK